MESLHGQPSHRLGCDSTWPRRHICWWLIAAEAALIPLAIGLALWWNVPLATRCRFTPAACAGGLAATLPLLATFLYMCHSSRAPLRGIRDFLDEWVRPTLGRCSVAEWALLSAAAGVGEELLFRGVLQQALITWFMPTLGASLALATGLGAASLLFGLAHCVTPAYAIAATAIGLYFGLLDRLTDNLAVPIIAHAAYDFAALVYFLRVRRSVPSLCAVNSPSSERPPT